MSENTQDTVRVKLSPGLSRKGIYHLLTYLKTQSVSYIGEAVVVKEGYPVKKFGVLLAGRRRSYRTDSQGHTLTVILLEKGNGIGIMLAASPNRRSLVSVATKQGSSVLSTSYNRLINNCTRDCPCHRQLLENFVQIVAEKGLVFHERLGCLLRSTVRDKILTCLKSFSGLENGLPFIIPLNRSAMAEYLDTDHSTLSGELSGMKKDGIIDYYRPAFHLSH